MRSTSSLLVVAAAVKCSGVSFISVLVEATADGAADDGDQQRQEGEEEEEDDDDDDDDKSVSSLQSSQRAASQDSGIKSVFSFTVLNMPVLPFVPRGPIHRVARNDGMV